jgi:hypothetical protein
LAHELRNYLHIASYAVKAIKAGNLGMSGATGAVLDRSLIGMRNLIDRSLAEVRVTAGLPPRLKDVRLADFLSEIVASASLDPLARECKFAVEPVRFLEHYNLPPYWSGSGLWGAGAFPKAVLSRPGDAWSNEQYPRAEQEFESLGKAKKTPQDAHLRSGNTVLRYHIQAVDGDIGHIQAILIDERTWAIRYFIVNTGNWWLGHEVLIAPQWIEEINWATSKI